ncbi:MAG: ATP synthase F1 subunit gamma [Deltaproteobacteria bacterium]|nr:ATP synthase F1 subunit gamma [Deltaproteobacteria bacterium]
MPSLKAIKTRIASVKNTQKITRAMKLVAAAKMKRAVDAAVQSRPYSEEVTAVLSSLMARIGDNEHPLLKPHDEVKNAVVIVLTSDRGLCGGFNSQLLRKVDGWLFDNLNIDSRFESAEVVIYGKKARDHYIRKTDINVGQTHVDLHPSQFSDLSAKLISDLTERFVGGEVDEVYLAYNRFVSTLNQEPTVEQIFPLTSLAGDAEEPEHLTEFVYEPSQTQILSDILPLFLRTRIYQVFLESEAGEHAARMMAMDGATNNAKKVIDKLTLQYNRARQAAITKELIEIVSGAEAL